MGGQTPTWIRDGQMARKKLFYGRKDGKKKLMADIIFIKGKREDGRSPNSIMKYLLIFYCTQNIMKAIS